MTKILYVDTGNISNEEMDRFKENFAKSTLPVINEPLPNIENVETPDTLSEEKVEAVVKLPKDAFTNIG